MYKLPGVLLNNSLVIDFPLSFFKDLQVGDECRPLLLMVSKQRSVLIDLQAFIVPGIEPARCWVNRKIFTPDGSVSYGLAGVAALIQGEALKNHTAEIAILGEYNIAVSGLLPEQALHDIMISYDHFAIAIEYLKKFEEKVENAADLLLFFTTFIKELQKLYEDDEKAIIQRARVWSVFQKCAKIVDRDRNEDPVSLDAAEKQRWTDLLATIKSECRIG